MPDAQDWTSNKQLTLLDVQLLVSERKTGRTPLTQGAMRLVLAKGTLRVSHDIVNSPSPHGEDDGLQSAPATNGHKDGPMDGRPPNSDTNLCRLLLYSPNPETRCY